MDDTRKVSRVIREFAQINTSDNLREVVGSMTRSQVRHLTWAPIKYVIYPTVLDIATVAIRTFLERI